jgi:L-ascorbate metabolism protein UlaG (beta-lactamase superfamily)
MQLKPAERLGKLYMNPVPTEVGGLSTIFKVGPRFFTGTKARSPQLPLGPFHTDPRIYQSAPQTGLRITWMGHSSSLVELDGTRILIDPVWDQRAAPTQWAGPKRFFAPPLALQDLPPIDAVIVSHDHYDHLGEGTVRQLAGMESQRQARWITPLGVGSLLRQMGVDAARITELNWTQQVKTGSVQMTALPTRHFSGRSLFNRFETLWASFALVGPTRSVYYGADSGEWDGFTEIGAAYGPFDLTMLEIGAFDALWADIHMGPQGAVRTFRALGGKGLMMPIHWGLFDLALHPWRQPIEELVAADDLKIWSPTPGMPTDCVAGQQVRSDWWR